MTDPAAVAARAAAAHLAGEYGPRLVADVEAALRADGAQHRDQYLDPLSLGSLIVSIAALAWTIYTDLKNKPAKPTPEVLARAVGVELRNRGQQSTSALSTVTDVVVIEIIKATDDIR
jgi:hypothetical protein